MNEEALKQMGLTNNEIKIYLCLLKKGEGSGSQLRQQTGISNSQVYASLDSLARKGVITYKKTAKGKLYGANNPEVFLDIMDEKKRYMEKQIPVLKKLQQLNDADTQTSIYEGYNGFKTALYEQSKKCPVNGTMYILAFSNQAYKNEKLAALLRDANKRSKEKKQKFKMILDNRENRFYEQRKKEGLSSLRFMQKGFSSPASINTFGDYVYIGFWSENPFMFVIKNKDVAKSFKNYFEFLWMIAEE
jgi:sugar-specific transcriptional regulator TrmB